MVAVAVVVAVPVGVPVGVVVVVPVGVGVVVAVVVVVPVGVGVVVAVNPVRQQSLIDGPAVHQFPRELASPSTYRRGCSCVACRAAHAAYERARRRANAALYQEPNRWVGR